MKENLSKLFWFFGISQKGLKQSPEERFAMVTYHRVCENGVGGFEYPSFFDLRTTPLQFEKHLQFYKEYFDVVSLDEALEYKAGEKPKIVISFDDGYLDNYEFAFPLLEKYKCPAIFYVVSSVLNPSNLLWDNQIFYTLAKASKEKIHSFMKNEWSIGVTDQDDANETARKIFAFLQSHLSQHEERKNYVTQMSQALGVLAPESLIHSYYMKEEQLSEMKSKGMDIGSHTHTHCYFNDSSIEEKQEELQRSKKELENVLGSSVDHFCFPNGSYRNEDLELVRKNGYRTTVTTQEEWNSRGQSPYQVRRFGLSNQSVSYAAFEMSGQKNRIKKIFQKLSKICL